MIVTRHKVAISISSFKSNTAAMSLVSKVIEEDWECEYILVVDSLGTGKFEKFIAISEFSDRVLYFNGEFNMGSAGNLHKRLAWANELGMDFVLALNHDAEINYSVYHELISNTIGQSRIGALYPLRLLKQRKIYDLSGKNYCSVSASGTKTKPIHEFIEVSWSSSNGALYSTEPLRGLNAVCPDKTLWMGWEDYLYGLQLRKAGYDQWIVTSAETIDNYEYKTVNMFGGVKMVTDKPIWYCYYDPRNLLLISCYRLRSPKLTLFILWRVFIGLILLPFKFKKNKILAIRFYLAGIRDGILNIGGKWKLP